MDLNSNPESRFGQLFRAAYDDEQASSQLCSVLDKIFDGAENRQIVLVCVGTDRSTGDAFGPIVGSKLQAYIHMPNVAIYGTLDEPVHAVNLNEVLSKIQQRHPSDPLILAVDACLGKFEHVGHIILERGPLRPGAGVKKTLPEFGAYTLTGVVNVSGFMEYFVLQNTRLGIVMRMSDVVVEGIRRSLIRLASRRQIAAWMRQSYGEPNMVQ
ncbi:MAG: spore protease YyaC [Alicyclobacillus herbarius]|uniref:spore protease YyaC n=1 Tax=Alicyclobacillus herbarius TaxID=122960 RepID=UPI0004253036|nr:spore protease YyaC [Alicyclobacillus herbarius]MCL6631769.1 spore protease YyaC [Alicyclobacillus herbarius]